MTGGFYPEGSRQDAGNCQNQLHPVWQGFQDQRKTQTKTAVAVMAVVAQSQHCKHFKQIY